MSTKIITSFLLSLLYLVSFSVNSMDKKDKQNDFWVMTSDNHLMHLIYDTVHQCERLKRGLRYSKICFTKNDMDIFIAALNNCSAIDYENNLNTIMKVAEKCGAYLLYAHCVSHCLGNVGGKDIDTHIIVPLLKKLTHNNEPDIVLSPLVALKNISISSFIHVEEPDVCDVPFVENKDYYLVNIDNFTQPGPCRKFRKDHKEEHIVFDKNKNKIFSFDSYDLHQSSDLRWGVQEPYLFKTTTNLILFYRHEPEADRPDAALLYDFKNKTELATFPGDDLYISPDERYISVISDNDLYVYNIENRDDIKCKKIEYQGYSFDYIIFSPDSQHLVTGLQDNTNNHYSVVHWHLSDFDWNNENYLPKSFMLKDVTEKCSIEFCGDNNNLFINKNNDFLEIINLENQDSNGNYISKCLKNGWLICTGIDLAIKYAIQQPDNNQVDEESDNESTDFEIYGIKDLSHSLYHYTGEFNIKTHLVYRSNSSYLAINIPKIKKSLLLHYDATNNRILDATNDIKGYVFSLNNKGWVATSTYKTYTEKPTKNIFVFNNKGKKVIQLSCDDSVFGVELSPEGHDLKIFRYLHKMNANASEKTQCLKSTFLEKPRNRLLFKTTLYTQEELEQCTELYDGVTSQQYAFFDTVYSDCHQRNTDNVLCLKKDTPLEKAFCSFTPDQKGFIIDKLKVIEQSK